MKKLFILCFCILCCYSLIAQRVSENIAEERKAGELLSTDPLIGGKLHYKAVPFALKKGMGAIFFMQSTAFTPLVFLMTAQGKEFGTPRSNPVKDEQEAIVSFIAAADTSFYIVLTSAQENRTGIFTYGYRLLQPDQMIFKKDFNGCQKIEYLINQWQLNWELIPSTKEFYTDNDDPLDSYEYKATDHTLAGVSKAKIMGEYVEKMYGSRDTSDIMAKFHYSKFSNLAEGCINLKTAIWSTQTEKKETKIGAVTITQNITHFFLKGAKPDEAKKSFKIIHSVPWPIVGNYGVEVLLIFN